MLRLNLWQTQRIAKGAASGLSPLASGLLTSAFQLVGMAFESTHAASQPLANLKDCQRTCLLPYASGD